MRLTSKKLICQPERVPGIINVRPDTSDTAETILLPELAANLLYPRSKELAISAVKCDRVVFRKRNSSDRSAHSLR